jgi:hypothetical protein
MSIQTCNALISADSGVAGPSSCVAHTDHSVRCHIVGRRAGPWQVRRDCVSAARGLVTERHQRGPSRVLGVDSRRAAAYGAPGGLWKVDARYIGSAWHGDGWWLACRHDGLCYAGRLRQAGSAVWAGQACCADAVRGCPCGRAARSPRARTYSGQRRCSEHDPVMFAQVRDHMKVQEGAVCKTVGSAYVGSNPTPATTSANSPSPARIRWRAVAFPVRLCPAETGRLRLAGANTGRSFTGPRSRHRCNGGRLRSACG